MKFLSAIVILFSCTLVSCHKDEPVEPPRPTQCVFPPGNRNFTWQLDTVAWFPSTLGGIWAFSDSDAYLMGNVRQYPGGMFHGYVGLHWNGHVWDPNIYGTTVEVGHVANDATGDDHYLVSVGNWSINPPKPALGEFDNRTKHWIHSQFEIQGELRAVWTDKQGYFIAVGDNGMVYTKDSYGAGWVYTQAPTQFNFTQVAGISKDEIYLLGVKALATGDHYQQLWRLAGSIWMKLIDNQDTTGTPIRIPEAGDETTGLAAFRCSATDSLYLYTVGRQSFQFSSLGQSLAFTKTNLSSRGLPFSALGLPGGYISFFSPNDLWMLNMRYNIYHWNGLDFQKIEPIPALPYGQLWGITYKVTKSSSGKAWLLLEMDSQVYAVIQGTR